MRRRVALALFRAINDLNETRQFARYIEEETGVNGPLRFARGPNHDTTWITYLSGIERPGFLNSITHVINYLVDAANSNSPPERRRYFRVCEHFISQCNRIFEETNTLLKIDENGSVNPAPDAAFSIQRASVLAGLDGQGFVAAREYIDQCLNALKEDAPDGAEAIRDLFLAAENILKQMFPEVDRLDQRVVGRKLRPRVAAMPDAGQLEKMCAGFTQWVNVGQDYRHEEGQVEMNQPSDDLTTLMVTLGFSYIRWLASIKKAIDEL